MDITVNHFLAVSAILFTVGVVGIFVNRKNIIVILMAIELILLSVNINLVAFSVFSGTIVGQIFAMLVLTVAAARHHRSPRGTSPRRRHPPRRPIPPTRSETRRPEQRGRGSRAKGHACAAARRGPEG